MKKHIIEVPDVEAVGVYAIHNKKNDKYYIGSSVNVKTRLKTHQRNMEKLQGSNLKIDEDLKTFEDLENFEFIVLKTFPDFTITDYDLREAEEGFIKNIMLIMVIITHFASLFLLAFMVKTNC